MRSRAFLLICLLLFSSLTTLARTVKADDEQATATLYSPETTRSEWICWPDCGGESVDRFDWYKMQIAPYQDVQLFVENTGNYSSVRLLVGIYDEFYLRIFFVYTCNEVDLLVVIGANLDLKGMKTLFYPFISQFQ